MQIIPSVETIPFEQARDFSGDRVAKVQAGGSLPTVLVRGPRLIVHVMPTSAFNSKVNIDHDSEGKFIHRFKPAQYMEFEERLNIEGWNLWGPRRPSPPPLNPVSWWCSSLSNKGITEIVETLVEVSQNDPPPAINGFELEAKIVETLDRISQGYAELGIVSPVILQIALIDVHGVRLERSRPARVPGFDRLYIQLKQIYLEHFSTPVGGQLRHLFDELWRAAGWAGGSPSFRTGDWAGYNDKSGGLYMRD